MTGERVLVGYWCPRGGGHVDLLSDVEGGQCGGKGWQLWMDVEPGEALDLPGWMVPVTVDVPTAEAVATVLRAAADRMRDESGWLAARRMTPYSPASWIVAAMRDELQQVAKALDTSGSLPRSDPDDFQVARQLLDDALFLRQNGERPPGAPVRPDGETWPEWDRRAEDWLRGQSGEAP